MPLRSLDELRRRRKKLLKLLEAPAPEEYVHPVEVEIEAYAKASIEREIADIDAEIAERTGAGEEQSDQ